MKQNTMGNPLAEFTNMGGLPVGTADAAMRYFDPKPSPYLQDPVVYVEQKLGEHLWSKQKEICESVRDNKYTAVESCHGPGKSFIASRIAAWWLDPEVHPLGSAFVLTTAPSWHQVQAILWRYIRRVHNKAKLPGRITLECHWYMGEGKDMEELIAIGRKPQDYDETSFQGIHARYVLALLDEACGVPMALWNAINSIVTNDDSRVLAIGNPDDPSSEFRLKCRPGSLYNVITIPAYDTPNFTGEPVPPEVAAELVTPQWVEERKQEWGEESNLFISKVKAEWPDESDVAVISPAMIMRAHALDLPGIEHGRFGMDVSRQGEDKTVIYHNRGGQIRLIDSWAQMDTMRTANKAYDHFTRYYPIDIPAVIDIIGLGAGVYDRLRERGVQVAPFQGSERAFNPQKFNNRRSESWWMMRKLMEDGLIDLDPEDTELAEELQRPRWYADLSGRICVESKEDMRKRGLKSPNRADAAIYSIVELSGSFELMEGGIASDVLTRAM